ncbi:MAG: four helix bundle protein [Bacteroidota bacterium]
MAFLTKMEKMGVEKDGYGFENLHAWQRSKLLSLLIYKITAEYPDNERYGLISQMRRAAVSIQSNIAEGSAQNTNKDQNHFYTMSYSSLMELLNQLVLSYDLKFCSKEYYEEVRSEIAIVSKLINGLRKSLR